jgi:hypothetical protein
MIGLKSITGPVNKAVNQVGNAANQVYKAIVPDKVENAINTSIGGDSAVGKVVDKTGQVVQKQVTAVTASTLATAKAFAKKPLPYIATVGLSQFLPYSLATSLVTAVRTGDFKPIVIDMGMNYASMGLNEFLGQDKNSIYGKVLTGMSLPALRTALGGGTQEQIGNAAVAGGAGAYVTTILTTPKDKGGYGLKPEDITHKMVTNATTAATRAILNGKSVGDAVVESALVTGGSLAVGKAYENLTKNSETLQTVQQKFDEAKQKVKDIWEGKPNLASDHEKMVLAGQAAKNAADHAMLANSFAKKLSQDYVDGKTFDTDAVDRAQKYAEDLYDSAIRRSQDYDAARGNYEREAISSGYAEAETAFDKASFDVRIADTALLDSQKEFSSAYQDYDDTVNIVESFTNSDIAKIAAENINAEVMQAREQLAQADEALGEGPKQFKTQEEFEAETNPQATTTPQQQAEQDALVKASQAYTQTPAERMQEEANLRQEEHLEEQRKKAEAYAEADSKLTNLERFARDNPEEAKAQRINQEANLRQEEHLEEERKKAEAYAEADSKLTNQERFERDNPELAMNQRINDERERQIQKDAEARAKADALLSPAEKLQRDNPEKAREIHLQNLRQMEHNAQVKAAEEAKLAAENREAERARQLDAANPNWREQEAEAKIQAERWKDPILKAQDIQAMREREQEAQVEAARRLKEEQEANIKKHFDEVNREYDRLMPGVREQEQKIAQEQAFLLQKYPERRKELLASFSEGTQARIKEQNVAYNNAVQAVKAKEEAEAQKQRELEEAQRQRLAKEKADLDEQHKEQVRAAEQRAKEKADADALAEHNAQVKAAEDARVAASKTTTQPATQTPATTEPKQTQIGATISQVGTSAFNAAIAQKIAEEKAARAREEALAKQEALKAEALAKQAAAREKAKADYEEKVRIQQEFQARAKAEAQAKAKADYDAKVKAQLEAKAAADAKAKADYDEKVRLKAEYDAKVKADQEARAAAYAKAKAEYDAKAKADYDARVKAQADAKAAYDEKVRLKAEYDAKVQAAAAAKAANEAKAAAYAKAKAEYDEKVRLKKEADALAATTGANAPAGTLPTVTKPTGTLTPVTKPTGTLTPVAPTGGLTPVTAPISSAPPTGGLTAVTKPVTTTPVTSLPTTSTSTTIAPPTGTLTPVTKPPTGGLTPVVKPPTGTLTPVTKPTGTLTPAIKPTGALTSVTKPTGTLTPV